MKYLYTNVGELNEEVSVVDLSPEELEKREKWQW